VLARVAQGQHRRLGALEERHAGVGERAHDFLIEIAAGERAERDDEPAGMPRQRLDHRAAELPRRRTTTGPRHVDAQVHRDDVDGLVAQHDVEELGKEARVLVHRAGAVAEALEIGDHPRGTGHPLRGADDRDARRLHQGDEVHRAVFRHTIAKLTG
jgi:hypothetical protein